MNQMSQQSLRQVARRKSREVAQRCRLERAEKERRVIAQAEAVMIALAERDSAIEVAETRAGAALRELIEVEGLSVREAVEWCGGILDTREATRLRRRTAETGRSVHGQADRGPDQEARLDAGVNLSAPATTALLSEDVVKEPNEADLR